MSAYSEPLKMAVIAFPFLAFAISGIFLIYEYRKYGTFLIRRALILYSFVFYLLCAYFLVILPLPARSEVAQYTGPFYEWRPFYSVVNFLHETVLNIHDPGTYLPALKQGVVLEPLFNLLLLVPFGVYLRYYFNYSLKKTILASFLLSLFFELTQLSGLYFIYPRPYRLADVNDLIMNTLGGLLGYWVTPIFTFLLPTRAALDEASYQKGQSVSLLRRLVAWGIDWLAIGFVQRLCQFVLLFSPAYKQWTAAYSDLAARLWFFIMVFLAFMVLPAITNGQTLGKKIVRIRIVEENHVRVRFRALFIRYGYLYFLYGVISWYMTAAAAFLNSNNRLLQAVSLILFLFCVLLLFLFLLNIIYTIVRKTRRLFYEKASHTYTISTIKVSKEQEN
jgi:glycopeptide antibiotics resistance protein/uncharacterized RDD family membrane protein YckC